MQLNMTCTTFWFHVVCSLRFDVAGVHPDNKKPGGYTQVPYFIGTGVCSLYICPNVLKKTLLVIIPCIHNINCL